MITSHISSREKFSQFNSFIPYEDKILGFNAYTKQFLVLEPILHELVQAAKHEKNPSGIQEIHPSFHQELIDRGFIVDDELDEVELIKSLREEVDFNEESYQLTINPTMNCNFKCWYCYESHVKGSKMTENTRNMLQKHISKIILEKNTLKNFHISWFGGEPMLYFEQVVKPVVAHALDEASKHDIEFTTSFTTNGYLIKKPMIPFLQNHHVNHFQITLDGHRDKHNTIRYTANKKGTYDQIIDSIKLLISHDLYVMVRINYTGETLDTIESVIEDFADVTEEAKRNMKFSFHNVWQDDSPSTDKLERIITNFRANGFRTESLYSMVDTVTHSCYADKKNHATVNYNGEVFKCTARDFSSKNKEGMLMENGDIVWGEKYHQRMDIKFKNKPCLECRLLPLCNGGCSQQALEHLAVGKEYCIWEDSGISKDQLIISRFKQKMEHLQLLEAV
ncbi:MAG: radical SAM protein [Bacteroidota bacterium]